MYFINILHDGTYLIAAEVGPVYGTQGMVGVEVGGGDVTIAADVFLK